MGGQQSTRTGDTMTTYYHGSNNDDHKPHAGICLTRREEVAKSYGSNVREYEFSFGDLNIVELYFCDEEVRRQYEKNEYPGDTQAEIDGYISRGVDGIIYSDYDMNGNPHRTLRLFSDAALAQLQQQVAA
jgi:hypothetical protein